MTTTKTQRIAVETVRVGDRITIRSNRNYDDVRVISAQAAGPKTKALKFVRREADGDRPAWTDGIVMRNTSQVVLLERS